MTRYLLASAAALGMLTGAAIAQTATSESSSSSDTSITTPSVMYAPVPVTTDRVTGTAVLQDGDRTETKGVTVKVPDGQQASTTITTKSYPFSNMITTITKTTRVNNGVATEEETTSNAYPGSGDPPQVMKTTRTYEVGAR
jgi:hypothetical protein